MTWSLSPCQFSILHRLEQIEGRKECVVVPGQLRPWYLHSLAPSDSTFAPKRRPGSRQDCRGRAALQASGNVKDLESELPDGAIHKFQSVKHHEDFWLIWRHMMPLYQGSKDAATTHWKLDSKGISPLVPYPYLRLQTKVADLEPVSEKQFADGTVTRLVQSLQKAMESAGCNFLAGPQIGALLRVLVLKDSNKVQTFVNPEVLIRSPFSHVEVDHDPCLLEIAVSIERPHCLLVKAQNEKGQSFVTLLQGDKARNFSQSLDLLMGLLIIDRASPKTRLAISQQLRAFEQASLSGPHSRFLCSPRHRRINQNPRNHTATARHRPNERLVPRLDRPTCFVAYHEAGHALLGTLLPVSKVEGVRIERGSQGRDWEGGTSIMWTDADVSDVQRLLQCMAIWLGGLAAEELMFGRVDLYNSLQGCIGFTDDLVSVAALATDFAAALRDPSMWGGAQKSSPPVFETPVTMAFAATKTAKTAAAPATAPPKGELQGGGKKDEEDWRQLLRPRELGLPLCGPYDGLVLQLVDEAYQMAVDKVVENVEALHALASLLMARGNTSAEEVESLVNSKKSPATS